MSGGQRLLLKLSALILIVIAVQVAMYRSKGGDKDFFQIEIEQYLATIAKKPDVIYFLDSVNTAVAPTDADRRSLSEMLSAIAPTWSIAPIDHAAYHLAIYRSFLRNMTKRGFRPKAVVVQINMRSFSTGWFKNAGWQFSTNRLVLDHDYFLFRVFFKPLAVFKAFSLTPITQSEFENMPVQDGARTIGLVKDFLGPRYERYSESTMKNKLIYNYMYRLTPEHELVKALTEMPRIARKNHIQTIFYVSPIDMETGDKYVGPHFRERLSENIAVLKTALENEGDKLLDLSATLPNSAFNWRPDNTPNEHLNERGRLFVAQQIARQLGQKP